MEERDYLTYSSEVGINTVEEGSQTRKLRDQISPHSKPRENWTCSEAKNSQSCPPNDALSLVRLHIQKVP